MMVLTAAVLLLVVSAVRGQSELCSAPATATLRFSVGSRHNTTGHHIIRADVTSGRHDGTILDVETATASCKDSEASRVSAVAVRLPNGLKDFDKAILLGYEYYPGLGMYKLHTDKKNWTDAVDACEAEGGQLLVANSKPEADLVAKLCAKAACTSWTWSGFHDFFKNGRHNTVTGQLLTQTGYTVWESGQPNNDRCGCISTKGQLCDAICSNTYTFVCELHI